MDQFFCCRTAVPFGNQVRALPPPLTAIKCLDQLLPSWPWLCLRLLRFVSLRRYYLQQRDFSSEIHHPLDHSQLTLHHLTQPIRRRRKKLWYSESIEDSAESHAEKSDSLSGMLTSICAMNLFSYSQWCIYVILSYLVSLPLTMALGVHFPNCFNVLLSSNLFKYF